MAYGDFFAPKLFGSYYLIQNRKSNLDDFNCLFSGLAQGLECELTPMGRWTDAKAKLGKK